MHSLHFYGQEEAAARMNRFGRDGVPFFFLIDFDESRCVVEASRDIPADELQYVFPHASNARKEAVQPHAAAKRLEWESHPCSFADYERAFGIVHRHLHAGNSFLANLTCATPVTTNFTLHELFTHSHARYKIWLRDHFTVFSPETFVRIEGGCIYSYPMKGTMDASLPDARRRLLDDVKEAAEHATITDLIRNDLSQVAEEVRVLRYRYVDEVNTHRGTLLQVSSEICGKLPADYREELGTLFFRLLPAGSVTGAPKRKTVEIIREAETYRRGYYTGVAGFFDGCNLDSAVLIRFVEQAPGGQLLFKSGGGITFKSRAHAEYEEMKQKIYVPVY